MIELRTALTATPSEAEAGRRQLSSPSSCRDGRGGYYGTLADQPDLFVRTRSTYDGVPSAQQPDGSACSIFRIDRPRPRYLDKAILDLRSFASACDGSRPAWRLHGAGAAASRRCARARIDSTRLRGAARAIRQRREGGFSAGRQ